MIAGQYAVWNCSDCGIGAPSNEMIKVTDRVLERTTATTSVRRGVNGGLGVGRGSANSYRMVAGQVCTACFAFREAQRRKDRRSRIVTGLLATVGLIIAVTVLLLPAKQTPTPVMSAPLEAPATVSPPPAAAATAPVDLLPPAIRDAPPEAAASSEPASDPAGTIPARQAVDAAADSATGGDAVRDALVDATHDALVNGRATRWRAGGMQGFVVVSAEQVSGGRTCRNVYSTTDADGSSVNSPTRTWCRDASGADWTAEP